jgi:hypothetical protein
MALAKIHLLILLPPLVNSQTPVATIAPSHHCWLHEISCSNSETAFTTQSLSAHFGIVHWACSVCN